MSFHTRLIHLSDDGRVIVVEIEAGERNFLLINVYAPTEKKNKDAFYERLSRCIRNVDKLDSYALIIGGDFNCVNDALFDTGAYDRGGGDPL